MGGGVFIGDKLMRSLEERKRDRAERRKAAGLSYAQKPVSVEIETKAKEAANKIEPLKDDKTKKAVATKAAKGQTVSPPAELAKNIEENNSDKPLWK